MSFSDRLSSAFLSARGVATSAAETEAHRKSKQAPHQGCLFSIIHNLGTKHNEWSLLFGDSLSGPRPAFVWLWAAIRYQLPQRKGPATHTHTHTFFWPWPCFFFLFFVQKGARISDWVCRNHVLLLCKVVLSPSCTAVVHHFSPPFCSSF